MLASWLIIIVPVIMLALLVPDRIIQGNEINDSFIYGKGRNIAFLIGVILTLCACFRYAVGTDYGNYARLWLNYINNWRIHLFTFQEGGFSLLVKLASMFYYDYASMFFIVSLITIPLFVKSLYDYSDSFKLSIILFILYGEWQHTFNGIKQYLAVAIVFFGYRYLIARDFKRYLLLCLLASTIHISTLVMIPVYFVASNRFSKKNVIIMILFTIALTYVMGDILGVVESVDESYHLNEYVTEGVKWQRVLLSVVPFLGFAFVNMEKLNDSDDTPYLLHLCIMNAAIMIAFSNSRYLTRFSYYTQIYVCLAWPRIIKNVRGNQTLYSIIITIVYFIFWIYETSGSGFWWIFNR